MESLGLGVCVFTILTDIVKLPSIRVSVSILLINIKKKYLYFQQYCC